MWHFYKLFIIKIYLLAEGADVLEVVLKLVGISDVLELAEVKVTLPPVGDTEFAGDVNSAADDVISGESWYLLINWCR